MASKKTPYDPYEQVKNIFNYKNQWVNADSAGDDKKKQAAAGGAASQYEILRANGYGALADELSASGVSDAKTLHDYYGKTGRTDTRSYLYSLGNAYGLSKSDIDNLITFDNQTNEISFGGKKIGKADAIVDGVSYWGDTSTLDNAFSDYVDRAGITRATDSGLSQETDRIFSLLRQEYDDIKNTNPFETDEAKTIMGKYDLAALQGRDNAVASGSASNGGNIDSFAAANALRQQVAITNQGQNAVLDAYNSKLENARAILEQMGVNLDRMITRDEAEKERAHETSLADKQYAHEAAESDKLYTHQSTENERDRVHEKDVVDKQNLHDLNMTIRAEDHDKIMAGINAYNNKDLAVTEGNITAIINGPGTQAEKLKLISNLIKAPTTPADSSATSTAPTDTATNTDTPTTPTDTATNTDTPTTPTDTATPTDTNNTSNDDKVIRIPGYADENTSTDNSSTTPTDTTTSTDTANTPLYTDENGVYYNYGDYSPEYPDNHIPTVGYREEPEEPEQTDNKTDKTSNKPGDKTGDKDATEQLSDEKLAKLAADVIAKVVENNPDAIDKNGNIIDQDTLLPVIFSIEGLTFDQQGQLALYMGLSPQEVYSLLNDYGRRF